MSSSGWACPRPSSAAACRKQTPLIAGTLFQGTKLALTAWFLALYLISQAKTGLSALALKRHLGVSYPTAWWIHHKFMQAMVKREAGYVLGGQSQVDDAYLGGELIGGKAKRGSENKVPFVAAVSLDPAGHPLRTKLTPLPGFTLKAIASWASSHLSRGNQVVSDGLACLAGVSEAGREHRPSSSAAANPRTFPNSSGSRGSEQRQDQPQRRLPCLRFREVRRAPPRRHRLSLQPSLRARQAATAPAVAPLTIGPSTEVWLRQIGTPC